MSQRLDDLFTVLNAIRRIIAENDEAIDPAISHVERDRGLVDLMRSKAGIPREYHAICQLLINERETLGLALDGIRRVLDQVDIEPRTRNVGRGGRSN